jgi:hypothetical protein
MSRRVWALALTSGKAMQKIPPKLSMQSKINMLWPELAESLKCAKENQSVLHGTSSQRSPLHACE